MTQRTKSGFRVDLYQAQNSGSAIVSETAFYSRPTLDKTINRFIRHAWHLCEKRGGIDSGIWEEHYFKETAIIIDELSGKVVAVVTWR